MKRFHIPYVGADLRTFGLDIELDDNSDEINKINRKVQLEILHREVSRDYGSDNIDSKVSNIIELGCLPFNAMFINRNFLMQTRDAYIIGSYFPALTSACSLIESILNEVMVRIRGYYSEDFKESKRHLKKGNNDWVYIAKCFNHWNIITYDLYKMIVVSYSKRNESIHFNENRFVNHKMNSRLIIETLNRIISELFPTFDERANRLHYDGENYFIRKEYESFPLFREYYYSFCPMVSPYYTKIQINGYADLVIDPSDIQDREISDNEFADIHRERKPLSIDGEFERYLSPYYNVYLIDRDRYYILRDIDSTGMNVNLHVTDVISDKDINYVIKIPHND